MDETVVDEDIGGANALGGAQGEEAGIAGPARPESLFRAGRRAGAGGDSGLFRR